ncbi:MAG: acyltransferase [Flavobacteriaceae bacterium]|nr:acyltransferase [Flavobacteriaceae bacterium]
MKTFLKDQIKKREGLYLKLRLIKRTGVSLYCINFFFQRVLRFQGKVKFNLNFTSRVVGNNLSYQKDLSTLSSFAISGNSYVQSVNGIFLGRNFLFGPGLRLISSNHDKSNRDISVKAEPIIIGDNCWFGANVIILPGVKIGNNCIVGAGSIITKSFTEDNLIIAGNPGKIIQKNTAL